MSHNKRWRAFAPDYGKWAIFHNSQPPEEKTPLIDLECTKSGQPITSQPNAFDSFEE